MATIGSHVVSLDRAGLGRRTRGSGAAATPSARPGPTSLWAPAHVLGASSACRGVATQRGIARREVVSASQRRAPGAPQSVAEDGLGGEEPIVLVCDIGGTNARVTLWHGDRRLFVETYPTDAFNPGSEDGFERVLETALAEADCGRPGAGCIAIAGPVVNNVGQMTNINWRINGEAVEEKFGFRTSVINDFEAVGYGIAALPAEDLVVLHDAPVNPTGPVAVLGPGTGLGEAQLMWDTGLQSYKVWPSEGSHADFAPRGWKQRALLSFAEQELNGHCEVEQVACGSGLERIYRFLCSDLDSHMPERDACMVRPSARGIAQAALDRTDNHAVEALDMFLSIIGQEAGHMALRTMATGGVYIAGGILPKNAQRLESGGLVEGYLNRASRFHAVIKNYRLTMVKNEKVGLIGARECALRLAKAL